MWLSKKFGTKKMRSETGNLGPSSQSHFLLYGLEEITNSLSFKFFIPRKLIISPDSLERYDVKWHNAYNSTRKIEKRFASTFVTLLLRVLVFFESNYFRQLSWAQWSQEDRDIYVWIFSFSSKKTEAPPLKTPKYEPQPCSFYFSQMMRCTVYKNVSSTTHLCFVTFQKLDFGQVM